MIESARQAMHGFGVRWVLFSALGLGTGLAIGLGIAEPVEALVGMMLVTPVILALAGSVFGASQWLAVRRWHRAGLVWILASALALGLGMTIGIVVVEMAGRALTGEQMRLFSASPLERVLSLTAIGLLTGLVVGAAQCLALRKYRTLSRTWIVRCTVAFGLGLPAGGLTADLLLGGLEGAAGLAIFLGTAGLIVGLFTARAAHRMAAGLPARGIV